jgi:fructuronate reductase
MLDTEAVFGADLPRAGAFVAAVTDAYALLCDKGARAAVAATA